MRQLNTEAAKQLAMLFPRSSLLVGGGAVVKGAVAGGIGRQPRSASRCWLRQPRCSGLDDVINFANKVDDGGEGARLMKALNGREGREYAAPEAQQDDWLRRPMAAITRAGVAAGYTGVADDLLALVPLLWQTVWHSLCLKYKNKLRTLGRYAWDALATLT